MDRASSRPHSAPAGHLGDRTRRARLDRSARSSHGNPPSDGIPGQSANEATTLIGASSWRLLTAVGYMSSLSAVVRAGPEQWISGDRDNGCREGTRS